VVSEDYRHYAAQCLALAKAAKDGASRARLLAMAERWRSMAEKVATREQSVEAKDRGAA